MSKIIQNKSQNSSSTTILVKGVFPKDYKHKDASNIDLSADSSTQDSDGVYDL